MFVSTQAERILQRAETNEAKSKAKMTTEAREDKAGQQLEVSQPAPI